MVAYSFKARFEEPIRVGLAARGGAYARASRAIGVRPKRQTIRAGAQRADGTWWSKPAGGRRHAQPGDVAQLYVGMRTKRCKKIADVRCRSLHAITMNVGNLELWVFIDGVLLSPPQMGAFARRDGFANWRDMRDFWLENHGAGDFSGVLIEWEPMS